MAGGQLTSVLAHLRRIGRARRRGLAPPDAELLGRFLDRRDADAFAQLVDRHGPLVWNVCVRVLQHDHDAEDAFQATFLILARKARSIQKQPSLASWLYGVAYRTATRARQRRKNERERTMNYATNGVATASPPDSTWQDLRPILDEEVNQLPEKYRTPVVLCYFEGQTNDEAARTLGWPKGTVAGRLARARDLLRERLTRRGLAFSSAGLGSLIAANAASATMPGAFLSTIPPAAFAFAAGKAAGASSATAIAEGVLHAMFITKLRIAAVVCLGAILLTLGGGTIAYKALAGGETTVLANGKNGAAFVNGEGGDQVIAKPKPEELLVGHWVRESYTGSGTRPPFDENALLSQMKEILFTQTTVSWIGGPRGIMEWVLRYGLDTGQSPMHLNLRYEKPDIAPWKGKGHDWIFEVSDDTLRIALPNFSSDGRPKAFDQKNVGVMTYKRQKPAGKPKPDAEQLLGTWVRVSGGVDPEDKDKPVQAFDKVIFTKDLFQFCFENMRHGYAWKIDATKSPKELDIIEKEPTPGKAKQKPIPCIYKLEGDRLEIAMGDPGLRPSDFAKAGKFGQHFVLKREGSADEKPKDDQQAIQGTWVRVPQGEQPTELPVAGGRILKPAQHGRQLFDKITFRDGMMSFVFPNATEEYSYKLDPSKPLKELEFVHTPKDREGMPAPTNLSLYELEGDTLRICMPLSGTPRPEGMKSNLATLYVLQREKAAEKPKTDEELIQGTWKWTRYSEATGNVLDEETYVFKTDQFWVIRRDGQEFGPFRFRLDTSKFPREFDAIVAMEKGEQRVLQGLYALDARTLKLGLPMRPEVVDQVTTFKEERPKSFDSAKQLKSFDHQGAAPAGASQTAAEKPKTDEELIQGRWRSNYRLTGSDKQLTTQIWIVKGDKIRAPYLVQPGENSFKYRLHPATNPKGFDWIYSEQEDPWLLIYELKGDVLRVARANNALAGRPKSFADTDLHIQEFVREAPPQTAVVPLKHTMATRGLELIGSIYGQLDGKREGRPHVVADPRTNALIVRGNQQELDEIKAAIATLDASAEKAPATSPRIREIVKEMIATAKMEADLTSQDYLAGRGTIDVLCAASRKVAEAHQHIPDDRVAYLAAIMAHLRRMEEAEAMARRRHESGKITGAEMAAIKYARLEAELWLEREKAKPKGQEQGRIEIQRMRVELAEAALAVKKERVTWSETMFKKGFLADSQLTAAKADVKAAEIAVAEAKLELDRLLKEAGTNPEGSAPSEKGK